MFAVDIDILGTMYFRDFREAFENDKDKNDSYILLTNPN